MRAPICVLLVEDDRAQRELLSAHIRAERDLELAAAAADGAEGLALARETAPDVILLDLILPKLDGLEFLRRYRRDGGKAFVLVFTRAGAARSPTWPLPPAPTTCW